MSMTSPAVQTTPDYCDAEIAPLPLAACGPIWFAASAGLWWGIAALVGLFA